MERNLDGSAEGIRVLNPRGILRAMPGNLALSSALTFLCFCFGSRPHDPSSRIPFLAKAHTHIPWLLEQKPRTLLTTK